MRPFYWLLGLLLLSFAGVLTYFGSGAYDVAADEPHWPVTRAWMEKVRGSSIAARSSNIEVPELDNPSLVTAGAGNYDAMCTACHLKPGLESTELSAGLYPAPPDFTKRGPDDPAAAFWTIKHGVKMTGMPAWGRSMEDHYIWGMVSFLRKLPDLTQEQYAAIVAASGGHRHGGSEGGTSEAESAAGHEHAAEPAEGDHSHDDDHSRARLRQP